MVEKILFTIASFALFMIIFLKMIHKNDTNYIYLLAAQAIGIILKFISLLFSFEMPLIITMICYIVSIVLPIAILIIENKKMNFSEIICVIYSYIYKDNEKVKNFTMKLIEKYPNSYYAHKILAQVYEKQEKYDIAAEEYMRAMDKNNEDSNLYYRIAFSLNNINKKEEAKNILNEVLKKKPDYYEASLLLTDILYESEDFREAINVCYEALKYKPDNFELYYNLGMLYTRLNDFQTAKEYYEKAAELNSYNYGAKYNLAQIALIYNELDEAEEYFLECINNECNEEGSYYYLAYIEMLKGDKQKAINYLNIAVEENEKYYDKAKKEVVFKLIISKINKPTGNRKKGKKLTTKEEETITHLENTYDIVGNLNNNDIKAMRTINKENKLQKERE